MRINIYYGGRGLIDDPTIYVMNKLTSVLEELRVQVTRYNLYEDKGNIAVLPKTLKEADAVILAASVEWMGIGGLLQLFLDACFLYGDKDKISKLYMFPVVTASTYGEREAELTLIRAWELLGGKPCSGVCAYVEDHTNFEIDTDYAEKIEKQAEYLYRVVNQNHKIFPSSNAVIRQSMLNINTISLTPQESEQLSMYVSNDMYVRKQKEDIEELTQLFKEMLTSQDADAPKEYLQELRDSFHPIEDCKASYQIELTDKKKSLSISIQGKKLKCSYEEMPEADVSAKTTSQVMSKLIAGRVTFQGAFMSGELTAKGDFKTLRTFDQLFQFN